MHIRVWTSCLIVFLFHSLCWAEMHALIIGGSGEEFRPKNLFIDDFLNLNKKLSTRNWKTSILFNGQSNKVAGAQLASNANISRELEQLQKNCKSGDEAMIIVDAHGAKPRSDGREKSHSIMTEDQGGYSMDALEPVLTALNKKGCKVALMDLSCYSGNSQKLENSNGCTMTMASREYVGQTCTSSDGLGDFVRNFVAEIPLGTAKIDLQSAYLRARLKNTDSVNLPELSTLPLLAESGWGSFLSKTDPANLDRDPLDSWGLFFDKKENAKSEREKRRNVCADVTYALTSQLDAVISMTEDSARKELQKTRGQIAKQLDDYLKTYREIDELAVTLKNEMPAKNLSYEKGAGMSINSIPVPLMKMYLAFLDSGVNPDSVSWLRPEMKTDLKEILPFKKQIEQKIMGYENKLSKGLKQYAALDTRLHSQVNALIGSERRFYNQFHSRIATKTNPCSGFQL